jgi:putative ABC transport system substrate-binding protein
MTSVVVRLAVATALLVLAGPPEPQAQPVGKVHRIGVLSDASSNGPQSISEGFRQGLRERGWIEGQNIVLDYRFAEYTRDRLPTLAAELVQLKVDVLVAVATPATAAARNATRTIPIVMIGPGNPVEDGFIASLARPGGNVTGLTYSGASTKDLYAKQLELLRETVPNVRRVAILSNPTNTAHPLWMKEITAAGRPLGVKLQLLEARGPTEFDTVFAAMAKARAGALLLVADSLFNRYRTRLAELALKNRVPSLGYRAFVEDGGLMSYGPSLQDLGRSAAIYVDKILHGAKPADLPVEQPARLDLVINMRTARALGLTIPQRVLVRADHVID